VWQALNRCNKVQCEIRLNAAEGQGAKPAPTLLLFLISIFIYLLDFMIILIMLDLN
jgi:hypothetical protein